MKNWQIKVKFLNAHINVLSLWQQNFISKMIRLIDKYGEEIKISEKQYYLINQLWDHYTLYKDYYTLHRESSYIKEGALS